MAFVIGFAYRNERVVVQMMVSLGVYVRRGQRRIKRLLADPKLHAAIQFCAYLLAGFLLSAASLGNLPQTFCLGLLCAVGMGILRLPYAAMISALVAFTALIPVAGAYIGAGVGAFQQPCRPGIPAGRIFAAGKNAGGKGCKGARHRRKPGKIRPVFQK